MDTVQFTVVAQEGAARAGQLRTPHGDLPTPAFAPVGTQGAVKAMAPRDLEQLGAAVLMVNAYHLAMRPGAEAVRSLGGLHRLAGWSGPLMTDSGGFQAFSLAERRSLDPDGLTFRSHVDGARHRFTPESVMALQETLGADLVMPLDLCTPYPVDRATAERDLALTLAWAARAQAARRRPDQLLYGIVQGSVFPDLRRQGATALASLGFAGFALGGLSVGEPKAELWAAVDAALPSLPAAAPRHLLGVGNPEDLVEGISRGADTFDCVMPTRVARNGGALTMAGRLNLRNAEHARDPGPVDPECACYACQHFSRGAIRHWLKAGEILALHLLTVHNLHFTLTLVRRARQSILAGEFARFRASFLERYAEGAATLARVAA